MCDKWGGVSLEARPQGGACAWSWLHRWVGVKAESMVLGPPVAASTGAYLIQGELRPGSEFTSLGPQMVLGVNGAW